MGSQNQVKVNKGHQVQIFKKVYFWAFMQRKCILDIIASQIQAEVTKGFQVQMSILSIKEM